MSLFDLHCHLLPEIDDSFAKWDDLKALLSTYKAVGFDGVCFTPHLYDPYVTTQVGQIRTAFARASEVASSCGLFSFLGSEIYVRDELPIKGVPLLGKYYLVEFSTTFAPLNLLEKLEALAPRIPVIAHIERYSWLDVDSPLVEEFHSRGYLIQVNGKALSKSDKARRYCESGFVDLLASDCHGNRDDIIALGEGVVRYPLILEKMGHLAQTLKEVV